ncbi:MAG TPA: T9SS type A sorting domain-containing protein [Bacteroidia bacterium]
MKKILITIGIVLCLNTKAQTWVTIPDANFVTYLQALIPSAMSGNQLNTSSALVTTTTHSINASAKGIANLDGVQYFTSLTYLNCSWNPLSTLPTLPNSVTYFNCSNSEFAILPTLPNSLTYLGCSTNSITALPSLPNSLTYLDCSTNSITALPALPNSLTYLACGINRLAVLPALPNSLQTLICNRDSLTSLPTIPNSLTVLNCQANKITCFTNFPNSITSFNIDPNPYNCLPNYITVMNTQDLNAPLCAAGNSNGCAVATGIEQYSASTNVSIYPNPSNGSFVIEPNSSTKQTVQVYDVNGKLVLSQTINGKTTIDASILNEGVYNISLISNEGVINKRLVIVR